MKSLSAQHLIKFSSTLAKHIGPINSFQNSTLQYRNFNLFQSKRAFSSYSDSTKEHEYWKELLEIKRRKLKLYEE